MRKNAQVETFLSAEARDCADLEDVFDSEFERMCKGDQMTPQKNTFQIMFSVPRALPSPSLAKTAPPSRRSGRTSSFISVRCEKTTSVERNKNMAQLRAGYLFPEIARIKGEHLKQNPGAEIISLGIGDTTVRRSRFVSISLNRYLYFFLRVRLSVRSLSLVCFARWKRKPSDDDDGLSTTTPERAGCLLSSTAINGVCLTGTDTVADRQRYGERGVCVRDGPGV